MKNSAKNTDSLLDILQNMSENSNLTPAVKYALRVIVPNLRNGCFYGFDTIFNLQPYIDELNNHPNFALREVVGGIVVEAEPGFLLSLIPNISQYDANSFLQLKAEAQVDFEKFLIKAGKQGNAGFKVAIYSLNDTGLIRYQNINYPAFKLNAIEALSLMKSYGYSVYYEAINNFVAIDDINNAVVSNSFYLSPTWHGVIITIRYEGTRDAILQMERNFNRIYSRR